MRSSLADVSSQARSRLRGHSWPGNIRELQNVLSAATALAEGRNDKLQVGISLLIENGTIAVRDVSILDKLPAEDGLAIEGYEMLKGLDGVSSHEHREWLPVLENTQDWAAAAPQVQRILSEHPNSHGFLIRRHGLYTWGRDLAAANHLTSLGQREREVVDPQLELVGGDAHGVDRRGDSRGVVHVLWVAEFVAVGVHPGLAPAGRQQLQLDAGAADVAAADHLLDDGRETNARARPSVASGEAGGPAGASGVAPRAPSA